MSSGSETPITEIPTFDALAVLGRGIDEQGNLSETSAQRAIAATWLIEVIEPRVVVFTGGRSWRQVAAGELPPSEGQAMLTKCLDEFYSTRTTGPAKTILQAEEESTSTTENLVNSLPLLDMREHETLAILSDPLHFRFDRIQRLGRLTFPDVKLLFLELDESNQPEPTEAAIAEEKLNAQVTRLAMTGVQRGNGRAIMRRQHGIEALNNLRQKVQGQPKP